MSHNFVFKFMNYCLNKELQENCMPYLLGYDSNTYLEMHLMCSTNLKFT